MPIFDLPLAQLESLVLIFIRVMGVFLSAPILSSPRIAAPIKLGLALLLAIILQPIVATSTVLPTEVLPYFLLVFKESLIGVTIGFVANMVFMAVQMAGELADIQAGYSFAAVVDPASGINSSIIGQFQVMMAWMVFLAVDGHHILLNGLVDSFHVLPLGSIVFNPAIVHNVLGLSSQIFVIALQIGAPVIGAVLLGDLALGLLSRTVPQMNLLVMGFPVKMALSLIILAAALPLSLALERNLVYLMKGAVTHVLALAH